MPANSVFSVPVTPLLSMLCTVLMKILPHASAKIGSRVSNFALLLIVLTDVMAVKGYLYLPLTDGFVR